MAVTRGFALARLRMKFYVAAFVEEKRRVQAIHAQLRALGHSITVDWTDPLDIDGEQRDRHAPRVAAVAERDMNGVRECDVFILLADPPDGRAKYAELGAAIMSRVTCGRPRVYVLGDETHHSVFFYHPAVERVRSLHEVLHGIETAG
jgi:hypothetical protein